MHLCEYGAGIVVKNTFIDAEPCSSPTRRGRCRATSAPPRAAASTALEQEGFELRACRPPSPPAEVQCKPPPGSDDLDSEAAQYTSDLGFRMGHCPAGLRRHLSAEIEDVEVVQTPSGCAWPATPEAHFMPFFVPRTTGALSAQLGLFPGSLPASTNHLAASVDAPRAAAPPPRAKALEIEAKAAAQQPRMTAIAQLQELLQAVEYAQHFRYPPGTSVLQWSYGEHQLAPGQAVFRALVAFLRDGVAHHVSGDWERSKKLARQSAADAALVLLRDGRARSKGESSTTRVFVDTAELLAAGKVASLPRAGEAEVQLLQRTCAETQTTSQQIKGSSKPVWSWQWAADGMWKALVEINVHNAPHTFSGKPFANPDEAKGDAARRVLWYLDVPGFNGFYEPDGTALLAADCRVPNPPRNWAKTVDILF